MPDTTKDDMPPQVPENWDRCHFYLERKRRFCRQQPVPAASTAGNGAGDELPKYYCGNHQQSRKRMRVPCPVDPSHFIFQDMIEKHIPMCPKTTQRMMQQEKAFYQHNINTGGHGTLLEENTKDVASLSFEKAKALAERVLRVHQRVFGGKCEKTPVDLRLEEIRDALLLLDLSEPELKAGLADAVTTRRIKSGGARHLHQQASLVGNLRRIGALEALQSAAASSSSDSQKQQRTIVELGAGRGMTGLVVAGVSAGSGAKTKLVLVERCGSRGKADTVLRNVPKDIKSKYIFDLHENLEWERIQCDIAHVDMSSVICSPCHDSEKGQLVAVAKHLCGVGTDLALKSLEPFKNSLSACIFATCCHGVCSWSGFVGRDYLRAAMEEGSDSTAFGGAEFELMRKWSSGTVANRESTSQSEDADEEDEHRKAASDRASSKCDCGEDTASTNISRIVEALNLKCGAHGLGRACQRLIDYGRREYVRNVLFPAGEDASQGCVELLHYVSDEVTPQNAALVAYRKA